MMGPTEKEKRLARRIERGIKKYLKDGKKLTTGEWGDGAQGPACALSACMIAEDGHARGLGSTRAQKTFGIDGVWVAHFISAFDTTGDHGTFASRLGLAIREKYIDGKDATIPGTEPKAKKAKAKPELQVADPEGTGRILEDAIRRGGYAKDVKEQRELVLGKK